MSALRPRHVFSFAPISAADAEILILGSMPGEASIAAGQYYAHPRNAFWRIVAEVFGFDIGSPYEQRLDALRSSRVAVWDVLKACRREGSLDTSIEGGSEVPNDFPTFFAAHPRLRVVFFNGAKAEECWRRHGFAAAGFAGLTTGRLPSTSPANASWSYAKKLEAWREALEG